MKNILICDDDAVVIELIRMSLEEKGYQVHGALDGVNFRKKISEIRPGVIILDLNMIEIQGDEICRFLKNNIKTLDIPVIIFSSSTSGKQRALDAGADFFVQKRLGIDELEQVIDGIFTLNKEAS